MRRPAILLALVLAALFSLVAAPSSFATVAGELKTSSAGAMTITIGNITFSSDPSAHPPGPPWNSAVVNGTNLTFAGCPSGVLGTAGCLDAGAFTPTEGIEIAALTLGSALPNPFMQFAGNGVTHATILYSVSAIGPGSSNTNCATAVNIGDSCSIFAGSPLILTRSPGGTTVTLSAAGNVTEGTGTTTWSGQFTGIIAAMTPSQVQLFFCPNVTCTSADFTSGRTLVVPQSGDFHSP